MKTLQDKRVVVTGAASGIGRALAMQMAQAGARLYLIDVDERGLAEVADELHAEGAIVVQDPCDLSDSYAITRCLQRLLRRWKYVDALVNNAGISYYGPTENMTAPQWDRLMAVNLLAPVQLTRELLPVLLSRPQAHILNIASVYGLVGIGRSTAYQVSKFGLVGLSESLRAEYGRQGLGVTTVCPGFVKTNLFRSSASGHLNRETPEPPAWLATSPERVAARAINGMLRDRRLVVVTAHACLLYFMKRFAPGLIDWVQRLGRSRRMHRKRKEAAPVIKPFDPQFESSRAA